MGKHRNYSKELKLKAIKKYLEGDVSPAQIAEELNILSGKQLLKWVNKYQKYGDQSFIDNRGKSTGKHLGCPKKNFKDLEEENEYLRAKISFLEKVINVESVKKK